MLNIEGQKYVIFTLQVSRVNKVCIDITYNENGLVVFVYLCHLWSNMTNIHIIYIIYIFFIIFTLVL